MYMKKTCALIVLIFSLLLSITLSTANADSSSDRSYIRIIVNTPTNKTHATGSLTLNVSLHYFFASFNPKSVSYRIDEQNWRLLTVELDKSGINTIIHGGYTGEDNLPTLKYGKHEITVHVECQTGFPSKPHTEETTLYFSVDTASPKISNISIPNQAFNQPILTLDFTVNEPTSWMGYSLDNTANVTITGNTTITPKFGSTTL